MKILNMALNFGDAPDITSSEMDFFVVGKSPILKPESRKEFCDLVKKANYITIDSEHLLSITEKNVGTGALTQRVEIIDEELADLPVCPPFKCQWVELSYASGKSMAPSLKLDDKAITVLGMLVNETSPNLYDIYLLENHRSLSGGKCNIFNLVRNVPGNTEKASNVQIFFATWMKAINGGALGIEEGEDVVMLPKDNAKKDGKKKPHQIRRIVRIVPKNSKHKAEPIMSRGKIDFSHRWEVRGHWRRVPGMGKDREGNYEIRGLTWVSNFIKGPEELPLIQKLRWVPGQAS